MKLYFGRAFSTNAAAIAHVRGLDRAPAPPPMTVPFLPHVTSSLVVHNTHGKLAVMVAGPRTIAKYRHYVPATFFVQFELHADTARDVFGVPVSEVTDRAFEIEEVWGKRGRELRERVAACEGNVATTIAVLERALPVPAGSPLIRAAVRALGASAESRDVSAASRRVGSPADLRPAAESRGVGALASNLGVGERELRRLFAEHVCVSPKVFARVARIRRAVRDVGRLGWADLAAAHGFYDQPHLNAEFRALIGMSPGAFLRARFSLGH